jgi:acyl-CoA thioester hydrolase
MAASDHPPYRFVHRIRVGFDETDAQGVVYYGRYMPYFDRARVEYLRRLGRLTHVAGEPEFVMRAQHVEYHAPARFDDEVEVYVRVDRLGRTSVTWAFDAYRADTAEHLVSATQTVVAIDPADRRPVAVTEAFRDSVARFEEQEVEA